MQFKDVIGQQEVKQRLVGSVDRGRISHAQLFTGDEGSAPCRWPLLMRNT
ncbi:MAG: hypothetical protein ACLR1G_05195 [Alistipes indistinctus]